MDALCGTLYLLLCVRSVSRMYEEIKSAEQQQSVLISQIDQASSTAAGILAASMRERMQLLTARGCQPGPFASLKGSAK